MPLKFNFKILIDVFGKFEKINQCGAPISKFAQGAPGRKIV